MAGDVAAPGAWRELGSGDVAPRDAVGTAARSLATRWVWGLAAARRQLALHKVASKDALRGQT